MALDTTHFKQKLEEEKELLEQELSSLGQKNPDVKGDWEAAPEKDASTQDPDENVKADRLEELAERSGIGAELEERLLNINRALMKLKEGTFGLCEVCNKPIEEDRLRVNPSARTCKKHLNDLPNEKHHH
ncbi:MAG: TraR/DksA C4-type zinc finger protein [Parcubacteria group bacterium]|nr:TraR/DksA C4-type zinc finger protein [Parcubacteria group bacterium]